MRVGRCRSVVGSLCCVILLIFSGVGRCWPIFRKKSYSRVIFQFIFCAFASSGGSRAVATGSADAWPGTCAASAGDVPGVVDSNTVSLGVPVSHRLILVWCKMLPLWWSIMLISWLIRF